MTRVPPRGCGVAENARSRLDRHMWRSGIALALQIEALFVAGFTAVVEPSN